MKPLLTLFAIAIALVGTSQVVFAQETKPAVTAEGTLQADTGFVPCSGRNCSACDFVVLGNTAVKWLIGISFLFFAVLAVRAGFKLVISQGNAGALTEAKSSFTNAFIGLIIILIAYILVDTIMRQLVKGSGVIEGYGPWNEVVCSKQVESVAVLSYEGDNEFVGVTTVSGTNGTSVSPVSEQNMVSLRSTGVNVANWNGTQGPGRTDLVHPTVAAAVARMHELGRVANNGKAPFQVTAAYTRGVGHSDGSQHYKGTAVDLQPINGGSYDQIIQLCRQTGFTFINDERNANHIHCDMGPRR